MIKSPVTGSINTSFILDISVSEIVSLYQNEFHFDVSEYFNKLENIQLIACNDTGYRFYYPFNIYGDDKFYQHLQGFKNYYAEDKWEYVIASGLINANENVLEIGSGAGYFMQKLKAKGCKKVTGLELNSKVVETSRKKGLQVFDETIENFSEKNPEGFDVVCALQVLEHITDIRSFVSASLKALKVGGKLIFCVPNNNPYLHIHEIMHTLNLPPHHAGLWDKASFSKLPDFFPMKLNKVYIEPLIEYVHWYKVQLEHLKKRNSLWMPILSAIPKPIYKNFLRSIRYTIHGRNILVKFIKI